MQLEHYGKMAAELAELPLVIRTFDLGVDKLPPFLALDKSIDHALLQLRGLRFSLSEIDLLDAQVRAIVQVAQTADVRILFPMVIGSHDFAQAIAAVDRAMSEVDAVRRPAVGAMIETPAALFALDDIMELADFVAIGTNDLTQFMLAADRDLSESTDDCTAMHPAVLRAIKQVVAAAERWNRPVCVCGEEAGDADFACLLVGLGIRELSLNAASAAAVRKAVREIDSQLAAEIAGRALQCRSPREVREQLLRFSSQSPPSQLSPEPPASLSGNCK
jgi:phosphoenolpyruvate-protein kinase (PTS system EI component)